MNEEPTSGRGPDSSATSPQRESPKRAYARPVLTAYGTLARLTRSGSGSASDAAGTPRMAMCL
jgi:hypothetical protein